MVTGFNPTGRSFRGQQRIDPYRYEASQGNRLLPTLPQPLQAALLQRDAEEQARILSIIAYGNQPTPSAADVLAPTAGGTSSLAMPGSPGGWASTTGDELRRLLERERGQRGGQNLMGQLHSYEQNVLRPAGTVGLQLADRLGQFHPLGGARGGLPFVNREPTSDVAGYLRGQVTGEGVPEQTRRTVTPTMEGGRLTQRVTEETIPDRWSATDLYHAANPQPQGVRGISEAVFDPANVLPVPIVDDLARLGLRAAGAAGRRAGTPLLQQGAQLAGRGASWTSDVIADMAQRAAPYVDPSLGGLLQPQPRRVTAGRGPGGPPSRERPYAEIPNQTLTDSIETQTRDIERLRAEGQGRNVAEVRESEQAIQDMQAELDRRAVEGERRAALEAGQVDMFGGTPEDLPPPPEPEQVGTLQSGMGIGEEPPQGSLFENPNRALEGGVDTAPTEQAAAEAERRRLLDLGQQDFVGDQSPVGQVEQVGQAGGAPDESGITQVPDELIDLDPRFQFRRDVGPRHVDEGRVENIRNRWSWEPSAQGEYEAPTLWRDPADGRYKVIKGFHRTQAHRDLQGVPGKEGLYRESLPARVLPEGTSIEEATRIARRSNTETGALDLRGELEVIGEFADQGMSARQIRDQGIMGIPQKRIDDLLSVRAGGEGLVAVAELSDEHFLRAAQIGRYARQDNPSNLKLSPEETVEFWERISEGGERMPARDAVSDQLRAMAELLDTADQLGMFTSAEWQAYRQGGGTRMGLIGEGELQAAEDAQRALGLARGNLNNSTRRTRRGEWTDEGAGQQQLAADRANVDDVTVRQQDLQTDIVQSMRTRLAATGQELPFGEQAAAAPVDTPPPPAEQAAAAPVDTPPPPAEQAAAAPVEQSIDMEMLAYATGFTARQMGDFARRIGVPVDAAGAVRQDGAERLVREAMGGTSSPGDVEDKVQLVRAMANPAAPSTPAGRTAPPGTDIAGQERMIPGQERAQRPRGREYSAEPRQADVQAERAARRQADLAAQQSSRRRARDFGEFTDRAMREQAVSQAFNNPNLAPEERAAITGAFEEGMAALLESWQAARGLTTPALPAPRVGPNEARIYDPEYARMMGYLSDPEGTTAARAAYEREVAQAREESVAEIVEELASLREWERYQTWLRRNVTVRQMPQSPVSRDLVRMLGRLSEGQETPPETFAADIATGPPPPEFHTRREAVDAAARAAWNEATSRGKSRIMAKLAARRAAAREKKLWDQGLSPAQQLTADVTARPAGGGAEPPGVVPSGGVPGRPPEGMARMYKYDVPKMMTISDALSGMRTQDALRRVSNEIVSLPGGGGFVRAVAGKAAGIGTPAQPYEFTLKAGLEAVRGTLKRNMHLERPDHHAPPRRPHPALRPHRSHAAAWSTGPSRART